MKDWYPIDLHMHTVKGITRDKGYDVVDFSYVLFERVLNKYKFGLMAVTNHNIIDMKNYILMRYIAKIHKTNLLMGVELDSILSMGTPIHIAAIFNNNNFKKNYAACMEINRLTNEKKTDTNVTEIVYNDGEIIRLLNEYDVLLIPHGDKDRGIFKNAGPEQIEEALKKISEGFIRIFDSPSRWKMEKIKTHLDSLSKDDLDEFGGVLFSDNRDWNKYDDNFRDFQMNAEPTFKGLVHAITNPTKRFSKSNEIGINNNYIAKIRFSNLQENSRIREGEIELSPYYNCIIGKSGSGKSLLLHLIKKTLTRDIDFNDNYSFASNTKVEFYNEEDQLLNSESINVGVGANLFDKIITASTTKDSNDLYKVITLLNGSFEKNKVFNSFCSNYKKKISVFYLITNEIEKNNEELISSLIQYNSDISKLLMLTEIKTFSVNIIPDYEKQYSLSESDEFSKYSDLIDHLKKMIALYKGKYAGPLNIKIKELENLFSLAYQDIICTNSNDKVKEMKVQIINQSINTINSSRSRQASEKTEIFQKLPNYRKKIIELIKKIYINKLLISNFDFSINNEEINSTNIISKDKTIKVIEYFDDNYFKNVNIKNNSIFKTRGKMGLLSDSFYDLTNKDEALDMIKKYLQVELVSKEGIIFEDDFKPNVKVLFDEQDVVNLNPGDISKKYISLYFRERLLENDNKVILFDQIENDVDKPFINDTIKGLIEETKGNVQLIVVTHDPIVAVNADPNNYILSVKDEEQKIHYRNFKIESTINDEIKTISDVVDGSKNVIKRRYEIYKGENLDD